MSSKRARQWERILGRLHRITISSRSMAEDLSPRRERNMEAAPTDPEVYLRSPREIYQRSPRPPTPHPEPVYDVPRITASESRMLDEILDEVNREDAELGIDIAGNMEPGDTEPTPYRSRSDQATSTSSDTDHRASTSSYVNMSGTATRPPPRLVSDNAPPPYESVPEPGYYNHALPERVIPIPQGSPPLHIPQHAPAVPPYYRDYSSPYVRPAYRMICHSAWYVQATPEIAICDECATSEHAFCATGRLAAVWRHLHVISRTFQHLDLHCSRCYKLLMKTRRAIDCYACRSVIISKRGDTEHFVYKVLCEAIIPRGIL